MAVLVFDNPPGDGVNRGIMNKKDIYKFCPLCGGQFVKKRLVANEPDRLERLRRLSVIGNADAN